MKRNGKPYLVDVETLQEALSLSRARVYDLAQRGILPRASRGRYDLVACVRAYVEWLREDRGDADAQALRRLKVERERLELGIRRREVERESSHEMIPANEVAQLFADAVQVFYAELLSMPVRVAPRLANISNPAILAEMLKQDVRAALVEGHRAGRAKLFEKGDAA